MCGRHCLDHERLFVELGRLRHESFGRVGEFVEFVVLVVWFFVVIWVVLVVFQFVLGVVSGQRDFVGFLPGRRDARVGLLDRDSLRGRAGIDDGLQRARHHGRGHPE